MKITTKGRHGIRAVVDFAVAGADGPVAVNRLAEAERVSAEFLEQIF